MIRGLLAELDRLWHRYGPARHFCFRCDRFTIREHRQQAAIVGKYATHYDVPSPTVVPADTPLVTAQPSGPVVRMLTGDPHDDFGIVRGVHVPPKDTDRG